MPVHRRVSESTEEKVGENNFVTQSKVEQNKKERKREKILLFFTVTIAPVNDSCFIFMCSPLCTVKLAAIDSA